MKEVRALAQQANKALAIADHLAYVTYPVINDAKLLAVILNHLHVALIKGMEALLAYDALYKRIHPYPADSAAQFQLFREFTSHRYHIMKDELATISDVAELVTKRQASPVEFVRKDRFIIASPTYRLRTLTVGKVKTYLTHTKTFLHKMNETLNHHE